MRLRRRAPHAELRRNLDRLARMYPADRTWLAEDEPTWAWPDGQPYRDAEARRLRQFWKHVNFAFVYGQRPSSFTVITGLTD